MSIILNWTKTDERVQNNLSINVEGCIVHTILMGTEIIEIVWK